MGKYTRFLLLVIVTVLLVAVAAGCSGKTKQGSQPPSSAVSEQKQEEQKTPPPAQKLVIRVAGAMPETYVSTKALIEVFKPQIEKNSGGRITVEIYPAGQLFVDKDLYQAVTSGSVEMVWNTFTWWASLDSLANYFDMPFLHENNKDFLQAMRGEVGNELAKIPQRNGAVFINWLHIGIMDGVVVKPRQVKKPEDMKGLKMRAFADMNNRFFKGVGAESVTMSSSEVYMGLQRGTIDGAFSATQTLVQRKWLEVAKNVPLLVLASMSQDLVANQKWWNGLDSDTKKIIMDAGAAAEKWTADNIQKYYDDSMVQAKQLGAIFYQPTPEDLAVWKKASQSVYDEYVKLGGASAQRLLDISLKK